MYCLSSLRKINNAAAEGIDIIRPYSAEGKTKTKDSQTLVNLARASREAEIKALS